MHLKLFLGNFNMITVYTRISDIRILSYCICYCIQCIVPRLFSQKISLTTAAFWVTENYSIMNWRKKENDCRGPWPLLCWTGTFLLLTVEKIGHTLNLKWSKENKDIFFSAWSTWLNSVRSSFFVYLTTTHQYYHIYNRPS